MVQIARWLDEDDSRKLLKVDRRTIEVNEPTVGTYSAASLIIRLGSRAVEIVPISCRVLGPMTEPRTNWLGRVDLIGSRTYHLYYGANYIDGPSWVAADDAKLRLIPFTHEFFEAAMVELFS